MKNIISVPKFRLSWDEIRDETMYDQKVGVKKIPRIFSMTRKFFFLNNDTEEMAWKLFDK